MNTRYMWNIAAYASNLSTRILPSAMTLMLPALLAMCARSTSSSRQNTSVHGGPFQFTTAQYPAGPFISDIALGDFTGNGTLDIAIVDSTGNEVRLLQNRGDGVFIAPFPAYSTLAGTHGVRPNAIAAGDVTGDGKLDLVTANGDGTISILLGKGNGTFAHAMTFATGAASCAALALADLTGRGQLDVVTANPGRLLSFANDKGATFAAGTVSVLSNDGHGRFATHQQYPVGSGQPGKRHSYPTAIAVGRFTSPRLPDVVTLNRGDSSLSVLANAGDGTLAAASTSGDPHGPVSMTVADITGSGTASLIVGNADGALSVLQADGQGHLNDAPRSPYATGYGHGAHVAANDFTRTGKAAIAAIGPDGTTMNFGQNNGDGTFTRVPLPVRIHAGTVVAAVTGTLRRNGSPDLVIAQVGERGNTAVITVLLNSHP